jgi:hypothetical protein
MWYMRDGAPAHFSRAVRDVLSNTHQYRCIGRGGFTVRPPRPPDFNPLDFYLWGHVKTLVYSDSVDNEKAAHHRIVDAWQTIRNFEHMWRSMMRRVEACIESHGGHFKDLL